MLNNDSFWKSLTGGRDSQAEEVSRFYKWLAAELAPTIQGYKPSTILSLTDTREQALLGIWRRHGKHFFQQTRVRFLVLRESANRETVLFYRRDILERCLA